MLYYRQLVVFQFLEDISPLIQKHNNIIILYVRERFLKKLNYIIDEVVNICPSLYIFGIDNLQNVPPNPLTLLKILLFCTSRYFPQVGFSGTP